ncbi:hypothetical protein LTS18_013100 [Coniosporium uncinatum]|uniref:Uncharacterized protein n=1 Tax=Coniosporium uncinatum TaxID=93489 RepID=A0ACC3DVL0_9PEZI|nr:hypothetical protein LTS18_013100 [Coniosporium uncinatum]
MDTFTTHPIIERPAPSSVTYDLSTSHQTAITLPPCSTWSSGLHWHERRMEYLRVVKGSVCVILDGQMNIVTAPTAVGEETAEVEVGRYVRHEWFRADRGREGEGEEVVVVERTEPDDVEKSLFFWNLNGVVLEAAQAKKRPLVAGRSSWFAGLGRWVLDWMLWTRLMVIMRALDNFPVFWSSGEYIDLGCVSSALEWLITHLVLEAVGFVGRGFGVWAVRREFTPTELYKEWCRDHAKKVD